MKNASFESFPLGTIIPKGWLKNQLRIQANGLSGHLEEHWADVGPDNGWKGGKGESWERGPYYLDGLVPLAYQLKDESLINKVSIWIEWTLSSQKNDGSFGPSKIETVNEDVNKKHDWWHYMIMLKAVTQYGEATGDIRVIPFLTNFFYYVKNNIKEKPLEGWASSRASEMLIVIYWLYKRTSESFLLELSKTIIEQSINWTEIYYDFPFWRKVDEWDWRTHVVNISMGIKTPGLIYELTKDEREEQAVKRGIDSLMKYHGQAHGMFSGDEWLSGTHPSQGVELCAVVEYMFSLEHLTRIFGDGQFGDILEKVAFNTLPSTISPDWTSHQYDQQVNQIICNLAERNWSNGPDANLFGLEPNFGCCTANMHQGWPKFVSHLWMSDMHNGLVAVSYAPCKLITKVGNDTTATVNVITDYPFRDNVKIDLLLDKSDTFTISFRIPEWCHEPTITIDDEDVYFDTVKGYASITREWYITNTIQLQLPMKSHMMLRNNYACSIERGPLVYVLPIKENWQMITKREKFHDWEIYPGSQWKYGILYDTKYEINISEIPYQPFEAINAPVRMTVAAKLAKNWKMERNSAGNPPIIPDTDGQQVDKIELVPYGSARLRIGEFPIIK